uniref:DUF3504 domain-containing protein n=1 Tax=Macrostomum lignano TaxID=282301 RepID=A0A1I8G4H0_9PLAT
MTAIKLQSSTSKNVKGSVDIRDCDDNKEALMVAKPGSKCCPVEAFKLYLSKMVAVYDWNGTDFFLRPKQQVGPNGIWYTKQAVGINTLGPLMKTISAKANLSKPYTVQYIRRTVYSTWKTKRHYNGGHEWTIDIALDGTGSETLSVGIRSAAQSEVLLTREPTTSASTKKMRIIADGDPNVVQFVFE